MRKTIHISLAAVIIVLSSLLTGCSGSMHARNVDLKNAFLVNPSMYKAGSSEEALYRYKKTGLDIKQYTKILVNPVIIVKEAELDEGQRANYQKLADNAFIYLTSELGNDYEIVKKTEPGAMRLQFAIIEADSSKPVRNLLSSASPIGIGVGAVTYGVTGKPSGVGEITVEMKVTDAMSGELLGAALDRRVGDKNPVGIIDTWYNADEALQYWAKQIRFVLCRERGGVECQKP